MYFHASQVKGIKVLEPRISNHNIPLVYLSAKRENTLVYLSNAVEKFCKEKFSKILEETVTGYIFRKPCSSGNFQVSGVP